MVNESTLGDQKLCLARHSVDKGEGWRKFDHKKNIDQNTCQYTTESSPLNTDTDGVIESVRINGVFVLSGVSVLSGAIKAGFDSMQISL